MDLMLLKLLLSVGLLSFTFIASLLPLTIIRNLRTASDPDRRTLYYRVIGLLNCFAGGVFLSTAILELSPKVIKALMKSLPDVKFPLAEFTIAFGFLTILITEQVAIACKEQVVDTMSPIERLNARPSEREVLQINEASTTNSSDLPEPVETKPTSNLRSVLLMVTLSLHSLFEGLAIGLQTDIPSFVQVLVAVLLHKVVIAFSMGLNLLQSELALITVIILDFLFSVTSPIGLLVGLYVDYEISGSVEVAVLSGVLQGIACGTFLYITCFEVLPRELEQGRDRLMKLLMLLVGFSMSCGVVFLDPENQGTS